ncbi:FliM/FliN family flagellar motor switch protein [Methylibium rhizosphaerae]|uniref:FliM/FliN family flagellar motor switch protein n=1 Tax=Methylibium rhizosphaerae TaxID=2570323 RepID=UPI00112E0431|nr:FliM/FliN family flagellar motor C-terminal domain-containing protein [Methylibium rhizosphaerae]
MSARPFLLVPATRLEALRAGALERVQAWARGWGLDATVVVVRVQPLDELAADAMPQGHWRGLGAGRWSWRAADAGGRLAQALYGADAVGGGTLAEGCLTACLDELTQALGAQGAPASDATQPPPLGVRGSGQVLLAVELDGLPLAAAACAAPGVPAAAAALPRPSRADRDAGFAQVRTRAVVEIGHAQATLQELAGLKPGDVLVLHQTLDQPAVLALEQGGLRLPVQLGRHGDRYAVQMLSAREPKEY